jgi:hypothetical protein
MADDIGQQLRREVRERAGGRCEYCRMDEAWLVWGCEVDHILSRKHGGATESSNLAFSCARCNRAKGTDIGSVHPESEELIRLYNPRRDRWDEHFRINGPRIVGLTLIGQVTVTLLQLNQDDRLFERALLQQAGRFKI